jgi:hypothetical protein
MESAAMMAAKDAVAKSLLICGFMTVFLFCDWRADSESANGQAAAFAPLVGVRTTRLG